MKLSIREKLFRTKNKEEFDDDRVGSSWKGLPLIKPFRVTEFLKEGMTCCALSKAAPARTDTEKEVELTMHLKRDGNR